MKDQNYPKIAEARIAVIISGDKLDMENLADKLKLTPTKQIHKGDVVGHIPAPLLAGQDQWLYVKELSDTYGPDANLIDLLTHLHSVKDAICELQKQCNVSLQLSVQSDHAHMFYRLMPETLSHLLDLGLPLEISSFSWGGV